MIMTHSTISFRESDLEDSVALRKGVVRDY